MHSLRNTIAMCCLLQHCAFAGNGVITLWMMPLEPAVEGGKEGRDINPEINRFNAQWPDIFVLNTHDTLRKILVIRSVELATPNWSWVRGQTQTLDALAGFAKLHDLQLKVRFLAWGEAFDALKGIDRLQPGDRPDLVQIGTTWEGYFTRTTRITSPAPFINDIRLMFFWKRLPRQSSGTPAWDLHSGSWEQVLESLKCGPGGSLVFPIGITNNLLHDYLPLARAGPTSLVKPDMIFGPRLNLTSSEALRIPLLLANAARGDLACSTSMQAGSPIRPPGRLISFVEADHEEVAQRFTKGDYLAIIEPVHFIRRWQTVFEKDSQELGTTRSFRDYAGVTIPPNTFMGGSSLAIVAGTSHPSEAESLQRFLINDPVYTKALGAYGHLPQGSSDKGAATLNAALGRNAPAELERMINAVFERPAKEQDEIRKWAIEMESGESLEALQQVWRRMGDQSPDRDSIRAAAGAAEHAINMRINTLYRNWEVGKNAGFLFALVFGLGSVLSFQIVALMMRRWRQFVKLWWKNFGLAIAGPIAAGFGLLFLLIGSSSQLGEAPRKLLTWGPLLVAVLLMFVAQARAWKKMFPGCASQADSGPAPGVREV